MLWWCFLMLFDISPLIFIDFEKKNFLRCRHPILRCRLLPEARPKKKKLEFQNKIYFPGIVTAWECRICNKKKKFHRFRPSQHAPRPVELHRLFTKARPSSTYLWLHVKSAFSTIREDKNCFSEEKWNMDLSGLYSQGV